MRAVDTPAQSRRARTRFSHLARSAMANGPGVPPGVAAMTFRFATRRLRGRIDWGFCLIIAMGGASAAVVLLRDGAATFAEVLTEDLWLFAEVVPKVIAGALIGALVRLLVPREAIRRWIGEGSGLAGLAVATLAGILFPAGPFTVFPLAAAFLVAGADRGAAVAFITAWLLLGLNRAIIWELPFFGYQFVAWRTLAALPTPILVGWLARIVPLRHLMRGA